MVVAGERDLKGKLVGAGSRRYVLIALVQYSRIVDVETDIGDCRELA